MKTDMKGRVCSADKVVLPMNSMPSSSTAQVTGGQRGQKKRKQREGRGGGRGKRAGGEEEEEVEREGNKLEHIQSSTLVAFAPATSLFDLNQSAYFPQGHFHAALLQSGPQCSAQTHTNALAHRQVREPLYSQRLVCAGRALHYGIASSSQG